MCMHAASDLLILQREMKDLGEEGGTKACIVSKMVNIFG